MTRLSVVVPARNELYLQPTIDELLGKAAGEVEVIVVLDGYWPNPPLKEDRRVVVLHRGEAQGMRAGINAAAGIATGDYFMKIDAHCMVSEGYDETLKANCEGNWVVIPRRKRMNPETWTLVEGKPDVDYMYLCPPRDTPETYRWYFKGVPWDKRAGERKGIPLDDLMIIQGSTWFTTMRHFRETIREMDSRFGTLYQEAQEICLKTWLSGGEVKIVKDAWYAHVHKQSRGYPFPKDGWAESQRESARYWLTGQWAGATRPFAWYIEHFWPVPEWPADWRDRDWFAEATCPSSQ